MRGSISRMDKNRRVVVTGMGAITPIGNSVEGFWSGIKEGKTGFGPITYFDTADYRCKLAAEVKDFDPTQYMDKKSARRMEQFCQFAVAAAGQAIADAGLIMEQEDPYMVGCSVGSGIGSLQAMEREYDRLKEKGPGRVGPMLVPLMISNMAAGNVSIAYGLKGKSLNVVTACATGTHSIGEAYRTIQYGDADVMVAGGTESSITPIGIAGFSALTALSFSEDPQRASIPFDKDRNGFVMGEGSAVVVLEELEHAKRRGAKIYAELIGYGCSSDAYHITSPAEDGSGAATAMLNALKDGGVAPEELTYINAHGTSTHHNDLFETRAIKLAFGEHAYDLKINSTKSMVGHLLGAAGAVEFVTCVKEIQEGYIHRTVGLRETEEELDLNYCRDSYKEEVPYALTNSLGFGGHNASLLLKKYTE
jgi:3-oxoacyl-[acyl-carrier-protein] synthase II